MGFWGFGDTIFVKPSESINKKFEFKNDKYSNMFKVYSDTPTVCKVRSTELTIPKGSKGFIKFTLTAPSILCSIPINLLLLPNG